jgi:aldehyde dehydrogenase (NAD+)
MGNYHGEAGFKSFTHYKSILQKPTLFELPLKYYPYRQWKSSIIRRLVG